MFTVYFGEFREFETMRGRENNFRFAADETRGETWKQRAIKEYKNRKR